ncbi:MAG TPA: DUF5683 domain-containing protein [Mucilaginibacter sp.]|jgi:hypothetical protein
MHKYLLLIWLLAGFVFTAAAQKPDTSSVAPKSTTDTLISTKHDTVAARSLPPKPPKAKKGSIMLPDSTHSPKKAVYRSLFIPGWGQLYNHRWWKVPLIYTGLGLLGWAIVFNNTYYQEFLQLSIYREHGTSPNPGDKYYNEYILYNNPANPVPTQSLYDAQDAYRRNRDLSILGFVGFWGINVMDAYIDAKFINSYTMDNNLSMKITPQLLNQPMYAQNLNGLLIPGLKITFTLK